MTLRVAIQMDPLESIDIKADSTFLLGLEAQARGYQLYHYLPENLTLNERTVIAAAQKIKLKNNQGQHFQAQEFEWINLEEVDVQMQKDHTNTIELSNDISMIMKYPCLKDMTGFDDEGEIKNLFEMINLLIF